MKTTCEHCKLWQGSESSSRAACLHPNVLGTTSFDDTCKHHNPKVQRDHAPMDDNGRISGWRLTSGAVMYGTTGIPMHSSDNNQIIPGDKVFYQSTDGTVKQYTRERIITDAIAGPFIYNDDGSAADVIFTYPTPQRNIFYGKIKTLDIKLSPSIEWNHVHNPDTVIPDESGAIRQRLIGLIDVIGTDQFDSELYRLYNEVKQ